MASIGRVKPFVFVGVDPDPNAVDLHAPGFPAPHDEPQPSDLYIDTIDPNSSKLWVYGFIADPVTPSWTLASSAGTDEVWLGPDEPADPALELWVDTDETATPPSGEEQEVSVSQSQPRTGGLTELWVDTGELPGKLKYNDPRLGWVTIAGGVNETYVGGTDPFSVSPDATSEFWYDTNTDQLKVRINDAWVVVAGTPEPPLDEVWTGSTSPDPAGTYELWYDTSTEPGVLKAKRENGEWETVSAAPEPPLDEVWVGAGPPDPVGTYELWVDNTVIPAVAYFKDVGRGWVPLGTSEVEVGTNDPYSTPEGSHAELWHDTSLGQNGMLKVRIGNDWRPVGELAPDEVHVSATDPIVANPQAELWIDTSLTPVVLKGRVNNGWVVISGNADVAVPEEVNIGPVDPRDSMVELWYDTTHSPGTLKANNFGTWESIGSEVEIGNIDPYTADPTSTAELWFNPGMQQLSARVNDQWLPVAPDPINEVAVQGTEPQNTDTELWFDISTDPGTLKVKVHQEWVSITHEVEPPLDEVWVGNTSPDPVGSYEIWYDTSTEPGVLKIKRENGAWETIDAGSEVEISDTDPFTADPTSTAELWYKPNQGELSVRINDQWITILPDQLNEVAVQGSVPANPDTEMWFDISTDPGTLKVKVHQEWVSVTAPVEPPLDEVWVGSESPDPAGTYEVWYDTGTDPGVLRVKRDNGEWEQVASGSEVEIGVNDPYAIDPTSTAELWFNPSMQLLSARVNDLWLPVAPDVANEFIAQGSEPQNPDVELWFDTSTDPGTLRVKVAQEWVPVSTPTEPLQDEVWVGAGPPDPVGSYTVWYDDTVEPGVLKIKRSNGEWETVASGSEVEIDNIDPYTTDSTSSAELWFNPSMGELSARVNDQWLLVSPTDTNEFTAQGSEPTNPDVELWFDTSTDPGTLKVKVAQEWVPVTAPTEPASDEVWVGTTPPDPVGNHEIWFDTSTEPGVLKAQRENGEWETVASGSEVEINNIDPYLTDPASVAELWFNPSMGELSARVNDQWLTASPAVNEFTVQGSEPTNPDVEMWFDISTDPPVLKAKVAQEWVPVSAPTEPPMDEVWVGTETPDPAGTYEIWYDTSTEPGTLHIKRDNGAWEEISASTSEVEVSQVDPYVTDPDSVAELWFDPGMTKLWARSNDQWIDAAPDAPNEFVAQVSEPSNPEVELWLDLSQNPAILKAKVQQEWVPIQVPDGTTPPQPLNEVHIGPSQPQAIETELWFDNTTDPGILKANVEGVWTPIAAENEVVVGHTDPYVTDPNSTVELWYDTGSGVPGTLYVRTPAGEWVPTTPYGGVAYEQQYGQEPQVGVLRAAAHADHTHGTPAEEVIIDDDDPYVRDPDSKVELWYDTSAVSGVPPIGSPPPGTADPDLPPGGTTGQALTKIDDTDGAVQWSGPYLSRTVVPFTTRVGWYRVAVFRGAGSAEITLITTGRNKSAVRVFTLSWMGESMQIDMRGAPQYGNYLPNFALHSTGLQGEQYLDIETTVAGAMGTVAATSIAVEMNADGPGSVFQPGSFTLQAIEIAAPSGTPTPWATVGRES